MTGGRYRVITLFAVSAAFHRFFTVFTDSPSAADTASASGSRRRCANQPVSWDLLLVAKRIRFKNNLILIRVLTYFTYFRRSGVCCCCLRGTAVVPYWVVFVRHPLLCVIFFLFPVIAPDPRRFHRLFEENQLRFFSYWYRKCHMELNKKMYFLNSVFSSGVVNFYEFLWLDQSSQLSWLGDSLNHNSSNFRVVTK